jgi:hypothetical protein
MMQPSPSSPARYDRPRFRQDLVAELVDEQGARFIDVMDPDSGNLFRFYEVEYSLACAMDGERDVPGIVKWAQEELGMTPSHQEVRTVIATLGDLGFIDTGADLAAGVVVGAPSKTQPSAQLELGRPGSTGPGSGPLPRAPEYALGAAGPAARRPAEPPDDVALGSPGRAPARVTPGPPASVASDVSIDLADHIAVRPADVQEAVRASKVMAAVDVPPGLLEAIEDKPTAPAPYERPDVRVEARPDGRPEPRDTKPEVRVGKSPLTRQTHPTRPPVELPRAPAAPASSDQPAPVPAAGARVSPVLIILLVLVALGAGGFLVWKYVIQKPSSDVSATVEPTAPPVKPEPAPPPPPPPPTAKIAMEVPEPDDVKAVRAGVIQTILADKAAVKTGDVIVKLVGDKPIEAELFNIARDQKRLQDQIDTYTRRRDAARAAGNKAAENAAQNEIDARQKTLVAKQTQLAAKTVELDKYLIHAPNHGTFAPAVKLGQKIAADDVIATIQRDAVPVATFKVADLAPFPRNASAELAVGKGELRVTCTVAEIQSEATSIKVICPVDPALTAGTDVTLKVPAVPATPEPAAPALPTTPGAGDPAAPPTPSAPANPAAPATTPESAPGASSEPGSAAAAPSPTEPPPTTPEAPKPEAPK